MKTIWHLLKSRTTALLNVLMWATLGSILKVVALLSIINGAKALVQGEPIGRLAIIAWVSIIGLFYVSRLFYQQGGKLFKTFLANLRLSISKKIAHLSLEQFEKHGVSQIEGRLFEDMNVMSDYSRNILATIEATAQLLGVFVCLLFLFPSSFFVFAFGFVIMILVVTYMYQITIQKNKQALTKREGYLKLFREYLRGFKSLKLDPKKMEGLFEDYVTKTKEVEKAQLSATMQEYATRVISDSLFFIIVFSIILWLMLTASQSEISVILQVFSLLLFAIGQILTIITRANSLFIVDLSLDQVLNFDQFLQKDVRKNDLDKAPPTLDFNDKLEVEGLRFVYPPKPNGQHYQLGPIDFSIRKGEIIFIVGGNGSGKSTFLKAITRLYRPTQGTFKLDGKALDENELAGYSNLFSVIFTDFHLFDRLYGLQKVKSKRVNKLIHFMGLQDKTTFDGHRFTNLELSTGQKKRLALITSFLDNRAIYIFDEVAADQDPIHRKFYYETILQDMKLAGKTIIAVSHDDHYFHMADRVLKMENGRLVPYEV
ncbi:MAG: ATP-binding cassette domain-containing protein [Flammeovirgaceae bacterium]